MRKAVTLLSAALGLVFWTAAAAPVRAEISEVRFGIQPGLTYLPWTIVQDQKLIEKHAKMAGMDGVKVGWFRFAGGAPMNDALLSGNLDFAPTGMPSLVLLWAKTHGGYKGLGSYGYGRFELLTRSPNVKTIKDFTDKDRIGLPGVKTSIQAILLSMAAEQVFGPGNFAKLDNLTVTRAHPDSLAAMLDPNNEINSHFSVPPFLYQELAIPGVHVVLRAVDVVGDPISNGVLFTAKTTHDQNPKITRAVVDALDEALALINRDPKSAAEIYLRVFTDRSTADEIRDVITHEGTGWDRTPRGAFKVAKFMNHIGMISADPKNWQELFFEEAHDQPGS